MALIDKATLTGIADRAASQYQMVAAAFENIDITGTGFYWQRITLTNDPDVEIPLLSPYYTADYAISLQNAIRSGVPQMTTIVTTMDSHFSRVGETGSWNGYCTDKSLRVSDYFNLLYQIAKGSYMLANNVFSESDDVFGNVEITIGPAVTFTDGINYGDGASANLATDSKYAPTQLKAIAVGAIGGTDIDLRLSVKDPTDTPTTIDVTIPAGTLDGAEIDIGTSSDRYLDVTDVSYQLAGSTGTVGDNLNIQNKKERQIAM